MQHSQFGYPIQQQELYQPNPQQFYPDTVAHSAAAPPPSSSAPRTQQQPPPAHSSSQSHFSDLTLDSTLEDLCARFIVNLPEDELSSMDRVCFQIEQAHWYYEDFVRPTAINPALLPSFGLKHFSLLMFRSCALLHELVPNHAQIWTSFMAYKERVPVCGAILISESWESVLLVKGWQKGASWSFPRGKINKEETEAMCCVREVLEETGFDLLRDFPPEQLLFPFAEREGAERVPYYVEIVIKEQRIRLYLIPNVPEDTHFETRTRKEISKIDWFRLADLPTWGKNKANKNGKHQPIEDDTVGGKKAKFYMVTPFISHLKLWIDRNRPKKNSNRHQQQTQQQPAPPAESTFATTEAASQALEALFFGGGTVTPPQPISPPKQDQHLESPRPQAPHQQQQLLSIFNPQHQQQQLDIPQQQPPPQPQPLPGQPQLFLQPQPQQQQPHTYYQQPPPFPGQQHPQPHHQQHFAPQPFPPQQPPQQFYHPPPPQLQQLAQQQQTLLAAFGSPQQAPRQLPPQTQQQVNLLAAFGASGGGAGVPVPQQLGQQPQGQASQLLGLFNSR